MRISESTVLDENRGLKRRFEEVGLELDQVWLPSPADPELENRQLRGLWDWVCAYKRCADRGALEEEVYLFPPVEPDCDPDSDWIRFERWIKGAPVDWNFVEDFGPPPDPAGMDDAQIVAELARVEGLLAGRGVRFSFVDAVPPRAVYAYLKQELEEMRFEFLADNGEIHLTGCTGWCEECFQQKWCETAAEIWEADACAAAAGGR